MGEGNRIRAPRPRHWIGLASALVITGLVVVAAQTDGIAKNSTVWHDGWVALGDGARGRVLVVNTQSGKINERIPVEQSTGATIDVAQADGSLIAAVHQSDHLAVRSIAATDHSLSRARSFGPTSRLISDGTHVWIVEPAKRSVAVLKPDRLTPVHVEGGLQADISGAAAGGGQALIMGPQLSVVSATGKRSAVRVAEPTRSALLVSGTDESWVIDPSRQTATKVTSAGEAKSTKVVLPRHVSLATVAGDKVLVPAPSKPTELLSVNLRTGRRSRIDTHLDWPGHASGWDQQSEKDGIVVLNQSTGDFAAAVLPSGRVVKITKRDYAPQSQKPTQISLPPTTTTTTVPPTTAPPATTPPSPAAPRSPSPSPRPTRVPKFNGPSSRGPQPVPANSGGSAAGAVVAGTGIGQSTGPGPAPGPAPGPTPSPAPGPAPGPTPGPSPGSGATSTSTTQTPTTLPPACPTGKVTATYDGYEIDSSRTQVIPGGKTIYWARIWFKFVNRSSATISSSMLSLSFYLNEWQTQPALPPAFSSGAGSGSGSSSWHLLPGASAYVPLEGWATRPGPFGIFNVLANNWTWEGFPAGRCPN